MNGLKVQGLSRHEWLTVILDGSEAEVLALEPGKPREVYATSRDGRFVVTTLVSAGDSTPLTVRLKSGR